MVFSEMIFSKIALLYETQQGLYKPWRVGRGLGDECLLLAGV